MKINVEMEMTPEEARKLMGLPDVSKMQDQIMAEMQKRVSTALDTSDPDAMLKAWMPMAGQGFEQFQKLLWEGARRATGVKKESGKG